MNKVKIASILNAQDLIDEALTCDFAGWDFSELHDRWIEQSPSWSYKSLVEKAMQGADTMLDMGTGGGEFLSELSPRPKHIYATESYPPNIPVAERHLEPLGIEVRSFDHDERLPFERDQFDLVINRYESFSPAELKRILKPGGSFITEQVGGRDNEKVNEALGAQSMHEHYDWSLNKAVCSLKQNSLRIIDAHEEYPITQFHDIGAVVYFLRAIPWQIPDFRVAAYKEKLLELHHRIEQEGCFVVNSHRFLIVAEKSSD